jgi:hypothetical protein
LGLNTGLNGSWPELPGKLLGRLDEVEFGFVRLTMAAPVGSIVFHCRSSLNIIIRKKSNLRVDNYFFAWIYDSSLIQYMGQKLIAFFILYGKRQRKKF